MAPRACLSLALLAILQMRNDVARKIGEDLKAILAQLRLLAQETRAARSPEAEAIEIAIVNLDSAIEILTE